MMVILAIGLGSLEIQADPEFELSDLGFGVLRLLSLEFGVQSLGLEGVLLKPLCRIHVLWVCQRHWP